MTSMKEKMSLFYTLVEILQEECTKAYRSEVSFMIKSLKTQVEKQDLIVPYFNLMMVYQNSRNKEPLAITLLSLPIHKKRCKRLRLNDNSKKPSLNFFIFL